MKEDKLLYILLAVSIIIAALLITARYSSGQALSQPVSASTSAETISNSSTYPQQLSRDTGSQATSQGKPMIYLGEFKASAYCPDKCCNGKWAGVTAMGTSLKPGYTVAVDPKIIPLGTSLYIEGIGYRTAEDTGGAIRGMRIDVCMTDHEAALFFGKKKLKVWRIEKCLK